METKPAIYTTEFWVTVLTTIAIGAAAVTSTLAPRYAAIAAAIATAAYAMSRGLAKQGVAADPTVPGNFKMVPRRRDHRSR